MHVLIQGLKMVLGEGDLQGKEEEEASFLWHGTQERVLPHCPLCRLCLKAARGWRQQIKGKAGQLQGREKESPKKPSIMTLTNGETAISCGKIIVLENAVLTKFKCSLETCRFSRIF